MFEIKAKDNMGRVGVLKTKHGDVKTPALMPVIHPRKQAIDVGKYGKNNRTKKKPNNNRAKSVIYTLYMCIKS